MMTVLRGLGPEYNMLITAMINSSLLLSFTELQSKINTFSLQNPCLCFRCLLRWLTSPLNSRRLKIGTIRSLNPLALSPGSTIAIPITMKIIVETTKEDTGVLIATLKSQWNGPWNFHRNSIHSRFRLLKHYVAILFSYQILYIYIYIYLIFILEILFLCEAKGGWHLAQLPKGEWHFGWMCWWVFAAWCALR